VDDQKPSLETRVLNRYPEVRASVLQSAGFAKWLRGIKTVVIDGETMFVRGGDMLRDKDQVTFEWARKTGLLSDAAIDSALLTEDDNDG
jgi:hypothetical protein